MKITIICNEKVHRTKNYGITMHIKSEANFEMLHFLYTLITYLI